MKNVKTLYIFAFWIGFFLLYKGLCPSIAMESIKEEDALNQLHMATAAHSKLDDNNAAVLEITSPSADNDNEANAHKAIASSPDDDSEAEEPEPPTPSQQLLTILTDQSDVSKPGGENNFFFINLPPTRTPSLSNIPLTKAKHRILSIKTPEPLPPKELRIVTKQANTFLTYLSETRPCFFFNVSGKTRAYHDKSFFNQPDNPDLPITTNTHLFTISDGRQQSLEAYMREGVCVVDQKRTSFTGHTPWSDNTQLLIETHFPPREGIIKGLFYVTSSSTRAVSTFFLVQFSFSTTPQFVLASTTSLNMKEGVSEPSEWVYVEGGDYYSTQYDPRTPFPSYDSLWLERWTSRFESSLDEKRLRTFLSAFRESLLGDSSSITKGPHLLGTILNNPPPPGPHEVLLEEFMSAGPLHVGGDVPPFTFEGTEMWKLTLKRSRDIHFSSVAVRRNKNIPVVFSNVVIPQALKKGFYTIEPLTVGTMTWQHTEGDRYNIRRETTEKPFELTIHQTSSSSHSFLDTLRAASAPYVTHLSLDSISVNGQVFAQNVPRLEHILRLTLRNCTFTAIGDFFRGISNLRHLQVGDFSDTNFKPEEFERFLNTLNTPPQLEAFSELFVTLPPKPGTAKKRGAIGTLLGGGGGTAAALAVAAVTGPIGWTVGGLIAGGSALVGGTAGASSEKAAAALKQSKVSNWTIQCLTTAMSIPSLKTLHVRGIPRNQKGCAETLRALEAIRNNLSLPAMEITLHSKKEGSKLRGEDWPEEDWFLVDEQDKDKDNTQDPTVDPLLS